MIRFWMSCGLSALVLAISGHTTIASAQQLGTITGRVLDERGEPVASAPVEARTSDALRPSRAIASATGVFSLQLPPGTYDLSVSVAGFERKRIVLASSQQVQADLRLIDVGNTLTKLSLWGRTGIMLAR